ncbi:MAG: hypothetical protein CVU11_13195 [Bacteroidetes bacterium HGW-Bacteroidetes-6]|jgi:hypothetical protein|nr:MAG: hypothetical protein CVU11_13195 [Bacteroidetes bacterium HGW-Bacteroidetes-6]
MKLFNILAAMLLLILVIIVLYDCSREPTVQTETHTETVYETVYDSIDRIVYVDKPSPVIVLPAETVFVMDSEKCEQLAADYFSKRIYKNILQDDSLAFIELQDTVYMNRLLGRTLTYRDRTPTEFITTTTTTTNILADRPRFKFYLGPIITYDKSNSLGIGGGLLLSSKNYAAGYSYDITNQQHYLSMYFSIIKGSRGN